MTPKNVKIETTEKEIIIKIDPTVNLGPSRSGKTLIVGTTSGNQKIETPAGTVIVGVNAYRYRTER